MSHRAPKRPKPKKQEQKPAKIQPVQSLRKSIFTAISVVLALLGGIVAVLTLLPRISVTPSEIVDPNDTFSASFTISNNNFIPLRHVGAALGILEIQPLGIPLDSHLPPYKNGGLVRSAWANHSLDMDDRFTITPSDSIRTKTPREASIAIVVSYQPWVLPWTRKKIFRFATHRNENGTLSWYSLPPN